MELDLPLLTWSTSIKMGVASPTSPALPPTRGELQYCRPSGLLVEAAVIYSPKVGMSLALVLTGVVIAGQMSSCIGPRRRWWLTLNNAIKIPLVLAAAVI